jgi:hypothetical protein
MDSERKSASLAGVFFIVAAVAAIVGWALYHPVLHDPRYIVEARGDAQVPLGACFEIVLAISVIGTAVTLYPIVRRAGEATAVAYVVGRLLEAALIVVGIMSLLTIVTLRQAAAGSAAAHGASLITTGRALVALHDWTFLFGPGLVIGINTALLASLMYRSGAVPRAIPLIGLIGGPVVFVSSVAVPFGAYAQTSAIAGLAAAPVFAWEMPLAGWMIVKGFNPSAALDRGSRAVASTARVATASC